MEIEDFFSTQPYDPGTFYDENGMPITPQKARKIGIVYIVLFFIAAIASLVIMFVIVHSRAKLYDRCSAEVVGVVTNNIKNGTSEDSAVFPVFKYTYNGRTYEQKSTDPAELAVGDHRTIHIDPSEPTTYYIDKADGTAVGALTLLAVAFTGLGIALIIVNIKSRKNERASYK